VLTVSTGSWDTSGLTLTYEWFVNDQTTGSVSTGDTGTTYTPVSAEVGKQVSVQVTATAIGYASGSYETAETKAVVASAGC
jgi:hypothetical protein